MTDKGEGETIISASESTIFNITSGPDEGQA
jgi:hypothetical protein